MMFSELRKTVFYILIIKGIVLLLIVGFTANLVSKFKVQQDVFVVVPKGDSVHKLGELLSHNKVVPNSWVFLVVAKYYAVKGKHIKAGEYKFKAGMSFKQVMSKIIKGKVFIRKLTIPEGFTNYQIYSLVNSAYGLLGDLPAQNDYKEGYLFPSTYYYKYGDEKRVLLNRMNKETIKQLNNISKLCSMAPPLKSLDEIIILASIVEREARVKEEQPQIARVYLNRLLIDMPLQADPTLIYTISDRRTSLNRPLTYEDLELDSPYNTYKNRGLPPTAISNPGKDAIIAVFYPATSNYLYFVADGKGRHEFAPNYQVHMKNVYKYRLSEQYKSMSGKRKN